MPLRCFGVALTLSSTASPSLAQDAAATSAREPEVIVTGTAGGAAVRRQQTSFSVSTLDADQIERSAPASSADLLTQIPGVWVESSGGVAGANINVLGFPEAGDAPHVTFSINGAPLYPVETLSFMEHSSLFRIDETLGSVEAQLGGPGAIFSRGEPGLTVNMRLREGSEQTHALIKYTTSDYSLQRADVMVSGEVSRDFYYMIGGYVATSEGIRSPQFDAEKGRQFTLNLTRRFDAGKLDVWTRITDDHGQWLLPMSASSDNDLGTFTQLGDDSRHRTLQVGIDSLGNAIFHEFDFSKGRGWRGSVSGINGEARLSEVLTLRDVFSFTQGHADTYGLVPDGGAVRVSSLPATAQAGVGVAMTAGGERLPADAFVQNYGFWVVEKKLRSFTNDLSLAAHAGGGHDLTFGYYAARWTSDEFWTLGNFVPFHNVAHGDLLNDDPSLGPVRACEDLQGAGSGSGCWKYGLRAAGRSMSNALYAADSWKWTSRLRLDAGVRWERMTIDYALDSGPGYPVNLESLLVDAEGSQHAYSMALSFERDATSGFFVRYTNGFAFPNFDSYRNADATSAAVQSIALSELGYKYTGEASSLYATGFFDTTDAFAGDVGAAGVTGNFKSRAYGLQMEGEARRGRLAVKLVGTWQHAVYTAGDPAIIGKEVMRQPRVQVRLDAGFSQTIGRYGWSPYGSLHYIGSRYADNVNTTRYDSYVTLDAGIELVTPARISLRLAGENLTDRHDPTEGDPRSAITANIRPILGRSAAFSVTYQF